MKLVCGGGNSKPKRQMKRILNVLDCGKRKD